MIASVAFRNFKALRDAQVNLGPFNLVLGPNGSGKTSLIEALMHLRTLAKLAPVDASTLPVTTDTGPDLSFGFSPPYEGIHVRLGCVDDIACDALHVSPPGAAAWGLLCEEISRIRSYIFDPRPMSDPATREQTSVLSSDGGNLAAVLDFLQSSDPNAFAQLSAEIVRLFPEFSRLEVQRRPNNRVAMALALAGGVGLVDGQNLSQGMLQTIAVLTLSFSPAQASVICIEEIDRGIHPRMLREIRDALYRLSYPESAGLTRAPVQVIATTHSPYMLDLFRDHPEEVIITQKHGITAQFERLSDRRDMSALLEEGALGDLWFSGILGGVPPESVNRH